MIARNLSLAKTPYLIQCARLLEEQLLLLEFSVFSEIHEKCVRVLLMYTVPANKYHRGTEVHLFLDSSANEI